MGNVPTRGCCGVMEFAEQDGNGLAHNPKKSLPLTLSDGDNSIAHVSPKGRDGEGKMTYVEAREAREVSSSERHTRRYRRKPTSIMLEGMQHGDQQQSAVQETGSFSSISDAGASILSGGRRLDEAFGRVAPPTRSIDDMSMGLSSFSNDDATDYAICRAMVRGQHHDESMDDAFAESRDDV